MKHNQKREERERERDRERERESPENDNPIKLWRRLKETTYEVVGKHGDLSLSVTLLPMNESNLLSYGSLLVI
jgi:hypothetical protein